LIKGFSNHPKLAPTPIEPDQPGKKAFITRIKARFLNGKTYTVLNFCLAIVSGNVCTKNPRPEIIQTLFLVICRGTDNSSG